MAGREVGRGGREDALREVVLVGVVGHGRQEDEVAAALFREGFLEVAVVRLVLVVSAIIRPGPDGAVGGEAPAPLVPHDKRTVADEQLREEGCDYGPSQKDR